MKPDNELDKERFERLKETEVERGRDEDVATQVAASQVKVLRTREGRAKDPDYFQQTTEPVPFGKHQKTKVEFEGKEQPMTATTMPRMPGYDHSEGTLAKSIEEQTARLPSDTFLWAAIGSIGLSLSLQLMGKQQMSNFVGQWAPTILIMGLYNKMVKLHGSD